MEPVRIKARQKKNYHFPLHAHTLAQIMLSLPFTSLWLTACVIDMIHMPQYTQSGGSKDIEH